MADGLSDERIEKAKRDAILTRGIILNHYAAVEFSLDELLLRMRLCDEYQAAFGSKRLPSEVAEKIDLADSVLTLPGRMYDLADDLIEALDALREYTTLRHLAAHGMLTVTVDSTGATMTLQKYRHEKTRLGQERITMTADQVGFITTKLSLYARTALTMIRDACTKGNLPPISWS